MAEKKLPNMKRIIAFLGFISVGAYFVFRADLLPDALGWQGYIDDVFVGLGLIVLINKYILKTGAPKK